MFSRLLELLPLVKRNSHRFSFALRAKVPLCSFLFPLQAKPAALGFGLVIRLRQKTKKVSHLLVWDFFGAATPRHPTVHRKLLPTQWDKEQRPDFPHHRTNHTKAAFHCLRLPRPRGHQHSQLPQVVWNQDIQKQWLWHCPCKDIFGMFWYLLHKNEHHLFQKWCSWRST